MDEEPKNVAGLCDVSPLISLVDGRTDSTRFSCILPDNKTIPLRKDRVKAISDGALIIKTNKSGRAGRLHWNKQGAVLGFEVSLFRSRSDCRRRKSIKHGEELFKATPTISVQQKQMPELRKCSQRCSVLSVTQNTTSKAIKRYSQYSVLTQSIGLHRTSLRFPRVDILGQIPLRLPSNNPLNRNRPVIEGNEHQTRTYAAVQFARSCSSYPVSKALYCTYSLFGGWIR